MNASTDSEAALDVVEQKVRALELFAVNHRLHNEALPPLNKSRTFSNARALNNAVDSAVVKIENLAAALPRVVSYGRSHIQARQVDYDPGELFQKLLAPPMAQLKEAAETISKHERDFGRAASIVFEQTKLFERSVIAEAKVVSKASRMPKPSNPAVLRQHCEELADASADVAELKHEIDVRSPLRNHTMSLGDAAASLGWVVSPTPVKHAREYKLIVNNLSEDILSRYIDLGCDPVHSDFAEALNAIVDELVKYVEKEHPAGLRWNYAQGATPQGYRRAQRNLRKDSHPIGDYYRLMHGALTEFVIVSRELGGVLAKISSYLVGAHEEMANAIENASGRVKPHGDEDGALKMLLISVQHELTPLLTALDGVQRGDKFALHCEAFREFINALQWSTATVQKMSPVGYIIDIENVTLLYLDKVDKKFANGEQYRHRLHKAWTDGVRRMMVEMKEYVKLHHPNELMFDTRRTRNSIDGLFRIASLDNQLKELRANSKTVKWKLGSVAKVIRGKSKVVSTWVKA